MTKKEAKQRIEKLKKVISYHRYFYPVKCCFAAISPKAKLFNRVNPVLI